jgi:hypothetical protein
MHVGAYLALYLRAYLPGRDLTGSASISGPDVTGIGTKFLSEVKIGDWIRFDGLPGHAFYVETIQHDESLTVRGGAAHGPSAASVAGIDVHDEALREEQPLPLVQIIVNSADLEDFPIKRDVLFQAFISAESNRAARDLADSVINVFGEGSPELQPPAGRNMVLKVAWWKPRPARPLGENTPGRHDISLNFIVNGQE